MWSAVQYSCNYFQRFIVKMSSDNLPLTVPNWHNSVGVSSKLKLRLISTINDIYSHQVRAYNFS